MATCFVIQPFDKDKFDRRFTDVFEPAIKAAGLEPYRVDRDPSVRIPIDQIEAEIRRAEVCFAELTSNNPNVWYELGYAFAVGKDVVMITEERTTFPFDIQHRHIITYNTTSKSDYVDLETKITEKLTAYLNKKTTIQQLVSSPVRESEGMQPHEITLMLFMIQNQVTDETSVSAYTLHHDMEKAGFNAAASNIATRTLKSKGFLLSAIEADENGYSYPVFRLTSLGEQWIIDNQDKMEFSPNKPKNNQTESPAPDDLPF